jgi:hypothetical protein
LEEACVCRGHDSGPIEPDNTPAAPGVDEMTWAKYAETLEANLVDLGGW